MISCLEESIKLPGIPEENWARLGMFRERNSSVDAAVIPEISIHLRVTGKRFMKFSS
jgi:hypothetical protein